MRLIDADEFFENYPELAIEPYINAPTVEINDKSLEITRKSIELGRRVGKLEGKFERPQGEWIYHKGLSESRECSVCGVWLDWSLVRNSFCPNCGAEMKGGAE